MSRTLLPMIMRLTYDLKYCYNLGKIKMDIEVKILTWPKKAVFSKKNICELINNKQKNENFTTLKKR